MALYESVFIARQDISATQVDTLTDNFEQIISDKGGSIERREYWGLRTLAYRIKKNRKGHYVLFNMEAPSDAVQEMERNMRLNEDVLRYMTVRLDELRADPSPIMQGKGDRDRDRADRAPSTPRHFENNQDKPVPAAATDSPVVAEVKTEEPVEAKEPVEAAAPVKAKEPVEAAEPVEAKEPVEATKPAEADSAETTEEKKETES
jgi:small subunit ribosomal protein S6